MEVSWYGTLPRRGDIVMTRVVSFDEVGARCILLEYGCIKAVYTRALMYKKGNQQVKVDVLLSEAVTP
jgi:translation initiation factor 2 alpha subunit (eIF-2alpha)